MDIFPVAPVLWVSYHSTSIAGEKEISKANKILPRPNEAGGFRDADIKAGDHRNVFLSPGMPRYAHNVHYRFNTWTLLNKGAGLRPTDLLEDYLRARTEKKIQELRDRYTFYGNEARVLLSIASLGISADDVPYWEVSRTVWTSFEAREAIDKIQPLFEDLLGHPPVRPPLGLRTQFLQAHDLDTDERREQMDRSKAWDKYEWPELYEKFRIPPPEAVDWSLAYGQMALWYEMRPPFMEIVWHGELPLDEVHGFLGVGLDLPFPVPTWLTKG